MALFGKKTKDDASKPQAPMTDEDWLRKAQELQRQQREQEENPEPKAPKKKLTKEERAAIRQQVKDLKAPRKELKKDLKTNGIKGAQEFEFFAKEVGLNYPEESLEGKIANVKAKISGIGGWIRRSLTWTTVLILILLLLAGTFIVAYISEERGHFTINLTADMLRNGFELAETEDFEETKTRLFAKEIRNSNATSIYEMNRGLWEEDGAHNGPGYMAYTFYIRNNGSETTNYGYTVNILSETLNTGKAAWVMFFEDDKQIVYAREQDDGKPEALWGYPTAPFEECAYDPEGQYFEEDGLYGIRTTAFVDKTTALQGYVENFKPGDVKKYTVVAWLEGDDPDCNNTILGGHCGFNVQFDRIGSEEDGYFKGLFRREFKDTYWNEELEDREHTTDPHQAHIEEESDGR